MLIIMMMMMRITSLVCGAHKSFLIQFGVLVYKKSLVFGVGGASSVKLPSEIVVMTTIGLKN